MTKVKMFLLENNGIVWSHTFDKEEHYEGTDLDEKRTVLDLPTALSGFGREAIKAEERNMVIMHYVDLTCGWYKDDNKTLLIIVYKDFKDDNKFREILNDVMRIIKKPELYYDIYGSIKEKIKPLINS